MSWFIDFQIDFKASFAQLSSYNGVRKRAEVSFCDTVPLKNFPMEENDEAYQTPI